MLIDRDIKKIFVNTFAQFGSKGASVLLSLFSVSLLTRYLGAEGYGAYTLVITYLSFFGIVADLGLNLTLVREFSREKNISPTVKATLLNLKLILFVLSVILPIVSLVLFPYSLFLKTAIIIGSFAVGVGNLISYGTSILQSQLRLYIVALIEFVTTVFTVIAILYFIFINAGLYYIIGAIFFGNLVGLFLTIYYIRDTIVLKVCFDRKILKKLTHIAIPIAITSALSMLYFKIDTIMLSVIKTATDVGIYGLAYNVLENILMFWWLLMASIFPLLSKFHGSHDVLKYRNLLKKTLVLLICLSVCIIFFGNIFDFLIMRILGGSKFFASMLPFKILLWAVPLLFLDNVFYNVILSFGKTKYLILPLVISLVVNVFLNLYAIPHYGYIGASYVTVFTEAITATTYIIILLTKFKTEKSYLKIKI
jgi:O-antigen/teichoic acid export membrane protein